MAGREMELRNGIFEGADAVCIGGRPQCEVEAWAGPQHALRSLRPRHVIHSLPHGNRETSEDASRRVVVAGDLGEGKAAIPRMSSEESYTVVVPRKPRNSWVTPEESVEGRTRG
jgi:hypothetical protein